MKQIGNNPWKYLFVCILSLNDCIQLTKFFTLDLKLAIFLQGQYHYLVC